MVYMPVLTIKTPKEPRPRLLAINGTLTPQKLDEVVLSALQKEAARLNASQAIVSPTISDSGSSTSGLNTPAEVSVSRPLINRICDALLSCVCPFGRRR
jgi:hypothetical protein